MFDRDEAPHLHETDENDTTENKKTSLKIYICIEIHISLFRAPPMIATVLADPPLGYVRLTAVVADPSPRYVHLDSPQFHGENRVDETLHFVMGMGLGWLIAPALAVETASLELTQPEGLALAASLTTVGTVAATLIVPIFHALQKECGWSVDAWVRIALFLQTVSLCLAAAAAHSTIGGRVSWALHTTAFLGSIAANLQRLAAMPWVINGFPSSPSCVSWLLAGGNLSSLTCALLGVLQRPGERERLSVRIYFAALLCPVAASAAAYCLLRTRRKLPAKPPAASCQRVTPLYDGAEAMASPAGAAGWLPPFVRHPELMLCVATNAIVQYTCWIVLGFLLPFAAARAAIGQDVPPGSDPSVSGGTLLGYTVEVSTVAVFAGSVVSAWLSTSALHCGATIACMCACLLIVVGFVTGWVPERLPNPHGEAGVLLVLVAAIARFIDGLVTPLLYRRAVAPFPLEQSQAVTQFQGSVSIAFTALGTWLFVTLVECQRVAA